MAKARQIAISNGLALNALEAGSGQPLIMIPGWSQTAAEFGLNIDALSEGRHVIALDMRGHGDSPKPGGGYRIQRLAQDLAEVIAALGFNQVDLLGHSMGSSIIWSYLDLHGPARLRKLVIVDQAPMATAMPAWGASEKLRYGCVWPDAQALSSFVGLVLR